MPSYHFTVRGNPLPLPRHRDGRGHKYIPTPVREWQELVRGEALAARIPCTKGPVEMILTFRRANRIRCDIDNLAKAVMDALEGIAYEDDSQIRTLSVGRGWNPDEPGCWVSLYL